jgi:hypothetical protein
MIVGFMGWKLEVVMSYLVVKLGALHPIVMNEIYIESDPLPMKPLISLRGIVKKPVHVCARALAY